MLSRLLMVVFSLFAGGAAATAETTRSAHDFAFTSIEGRPLPLADFRGKVVLVVNTASQCGSTRQYADLQAVWEGYRERGLVVLGVNCSDKRKIAVDLLEKDSVTYPNIVDSSAAATRVMHRGYRMSGVPLNYIIDREGRVAAAWYGYRNAEHPGVKKVLTKLGLKLKE